MMQTERLCLRRPQKEDLQAFLAYRNDPENLRYQPIEPMSEADALRFLTSQTSLDELADNCWIMLVIERLRDRRVIGEVGMYVEAAAKGSADIGWSLQRDCWRHGYALEAARRLVEHAFAERGLLRLTASMSADNASSVRLCERLGMRRQSGAGDPRDVYQYALSAGEGAGVPV